MTNLHQRKMASQNKKSHLKASCDVFYFIISDGHHRWPSPSTLSRGPSHAQSRLSPMTSMEKLLRPSWDVGVSYSMLFPLFSRSTRSTRSPGPLVWEPSYEFLQILVGLMRVWRILIYMLTQNTFKNNNHNRLPYCYNVFLVIAVIIFYCIVLSASSCIIQLFIPMNM